MFARLLFLFIAVPLLDLIFLILLTEATGWAFTLVLVLATGTLGAFLARQQGLIAIRRIWNDVSHGQLPSSAALDAMMILAAGALLLSPGVLTDIFGMTLLVPPVRRRYKVWLIEWLKRRFRVEKPGRDKDQKPVIIDSYVVDSKRSEQDDSAA